MSPQENGGKRPRALIVEDNEINRMVASQMLRRVEIDSEMAEGGAAAIERLLNEEFDVVLMDVQMPEMDGLETARRIRNGGAGDRCVSIPIVAMTAYASQDDEDACYAAGMDAYLSKPLNMQLFIETVQAAIDGGSLRRAD
jgi:CheY-like chemotaxis protein